MSTDPVTVTEATPRIAVFSDLGETQLKWLDNVIRNLGTDKVSYFKGESNHLKYFDQHRDFWENMSQSKNTPVLVFVDEDLVESKGRGALAGWNETYNRLLETLYEFTNKFAIVKIHSGSFSIGEDKISPQLSFRARGTSLSEAVQERAHAFRRQESRRNNTTLLGLARGEPTISRFIELFMRAITA